MDARSHKLANLGRVNRHLLSHSGAPASMSATRTQQEMAKADSNPPTALTYEARPDSDGGTKTVAVPVKKNNADS